MNGLLTKEQIVDTAMQLAEETSWESVRLFHIAQRMNIGLEEIQKFFNEKEDIVDAWFDRADRAMLTAARSAAIMELAPAERLHSIIMSWFNALQPHRGPSRQMILNKLEPGHVHYQWAGALRVSRTVQWFREAAQRPQALPRRAIEEAALSSIYLATVVVWMRDDSESLATTSAFLRRRLHEAGRINGWIRGFCWSRDDSAVRSWET